MEFRFALGQVVKEKFTGFTGTVMAQTIYYNGCIKYAILADKLDKDGKMIEWEWVDEQQLVLLQETKKENERRPEYPLAGGPQQIAPQE